MSAIAEPPQSLLGVEENLQAVQPHSPHRLRVRRTAKIAGTVEASPSKSYTHRAVIVASMGRNTRVENPLICEDTNNTVKIWRLLGADIRNDERDLRISGFDGHPHPKADSLNVGESGTLLRFVLPMLALGEGDFTVTGSGSLLVRPNREIVRTLADWGVNIHGVGSDQKVPVHIAANGRLPGGEASIGGRTSSQVVSALLMAAPLAEKDTILTIDGGLVSRPYIDITIDVLSWAGITVNWDASYSQFRVQAGQPFKPKSHYKVHGDYSSSAFLMAAALLIEADVTISGLTDDKQGDKQIIDILRKMGAAIEVGEDFVRIQGPQELNGIEIDCADTPDLGPILTTLGCFAKGETRIHNISHLKFKESNRILEPAGQLRSLGAEITTLEDSGEILIKYSADKLRGGVVSACNDHRIAMSLAVAGLTIKEDVVITGFEAVAKSYPSFVTHLKHLNADVSIEPK